MNEVEIQRQKEMQQAEELLFSGHQELGFAKGLFLGKFVADWAMPYPQLSPAQQRDLDNAMAEIRPMLDMELDSDWIDRHADIPRNLEKLRLGRINVFAVSLIAPTMARAQRSQSVRQGGFSPASGARVFAVTSLGDEHVWTDFAAEIARLPRARRAGAARRAGSPTPAPP